MPRRSSTCRRFGGGGAAVGPLSKVDLAEEIRKRKERAKKFGLPVPVFAAEVRAYSVMSYCGCHKP